MEGKRVDRSGNIFYTRQLQDILETRHNLDGTAY